MSSMPLGLRYRRPLAAVVSVTIVGAGGLACATRSAVDLEVQRAASRVDAVADEVATVAESIVRREPVVSSLEGAAASARAEAEVAWRSADEALTAATGSLLGETVYSIDGVRFAPGSAELGPESRSRLDQLADRLDLGDLAYRLEIVGYGDPGTAGSATALALGESRALAVQRYLLSVHALSAWRLQVLGVAARPAAGADVPRAAEVVVLVRR